MFNSIFIGLSGMNAFSDGLRQISNNITNINTTGFKSSGLAFSSLFSNSTVNYDASGQGVSLSDPRLDFSQGELRQTGRDLDLAIDGEGFLVLLKNGDKLYARTASFEVDKDGFLVVAGSDQRIAVLDDSGVPVSVSIDAHRTSAPERTTKVTFADNLSSTATTFTIPSIKVFDALGGSDTWQAKFTRATTDPAGEWKVAVLDGSGAEVGQQTLKFINGVIDPATARLTFEQISTGRSAEFDFSANVTSFSSGDVSTLRATPDGHGVGDITGIRVNDAGALEITYSNGETKGLGSVAIAKFRDPQSLQERNAGVFTYAGHEPIDYLSTAHEEVGKAVSGRLEASNVQLAKEFGDLILVQRGFQASSQVVSVSNDMIQQLFGIRGQG
jgi:flagellar hook protein FlgE